MFSRTVLSSGQTLSGSAANQGPPAPSRRIPPAWLHSPLTVSRSASHTKPYGVKETGYQRIHIRADSHHMGAFSGTGS
jgi:hypothetical protein